MLQPVGVVAVAAIFRTTAGLHIGGLPRLGAEGAQKGGGVAGAGAHFHVVGLKNGTALPGPIGLQGEYEVLKGAHGIGLEEGAIVETRRYAMRSSRHGGALLRDCRPAKAGWPPAAETAGAPRAGPPRPGACPAPDRAR